jgi:CubicO group peptidase (beta-lactamase class C family)
MQLVDAGRLDLDRDVNDYIDFAVPVPQGGVSVTLRRLLTHRARFEEHVKGLFLRNAEPEPLGPWLAKNLPRRIFPNGDVPIPIMASRLPDMSSNAFRASLSPRISSTTSSTRSA